MTRPLQLVLTFFVAVAMVSMVSAVPGVGIFALGGAAMLSIILGGFLVLKSKSKTALKTERLEKIVWWVPFLFFLPIATMPVAPGADMAMHVALARSLVSGSHVLSPSWGNVTSALYPRGLSAIVALASPLMGFAKAGLFAVGISYTVLFAGMIFFFKYAVRLDYPAATAALAILTSEALQKCFGWGGNPTLLALGLGLLGIGLLGRTFTRESSPIIDCIMADILLLGGLSVHPMGAIVTCLTLPCVTLLAYVHSKHDEKIYFYRGLKAIGAVLIVLMIGMAAFKLGGPRLSPREQLWIADYQKNVEYVFTGPAWLFFVQIWKRLPKLLGLLFFIIAALAAASQIFHRAGRARVMLVLASILGLAAIMAFGPKLPGVGFLIYPRRLALLLPVIIAPLISFALVELAHRAPKIILPVVVLLAIGALAVNMRYFQRQIPIATFHDLQAIECMSTQIPPNAVIQGAYGDATQWIPALTGHAITAAHPHCSLLDEIDAISPWRKPTFRFVGERLRYPPALTEPLPISKPLCKYGGSMLFKL